MKTCSPVTDRPHRTLNALSLGISAGVLVLLVIFGLGSAPSARAGMEAEPGTQWLRSELFFAVGLHGREPSISEEAWLAFLDEVVTPEFPAGFSYAPLYGQWKGRASPAPVRLDSMVIIILHPDTPEDRARVQAVRDGWNERYQHESVLWGITKAEVHF